MTETVRVGLVGYGAVGRAFWSVVKSCQDEIQHRHGLAVTIALVRRSVSQAEPGPDEAEPTLWGESARLREVVDRLGLNVIVQAIPGGQSATQQGKEQVMEALQAGADVVTATKSPLVEHWAELDRIAVNQGRCIRISAAAGAALPAVDLCRRALRVLPCESVRACLNGTTNFVLDHMRQGFSLREAVDEAVKKRITEPNPVDDLSGRDAAMKIVLLTNLLQGHAHSFSEVAVEGIQEGIESRVAAATKAGRVLRSIAVARLASSAAISVDFQELDSNHPLAALVGAEKGVEFDCGPAGTIVVTGGRSSPQGAAFALLKDVVNLATGDRAFGFG